MDPSTEHLVVAHLVAGPVGQTVATAADAIALFDRLRAIAPAMRIERRIAGRVVELAGAST